MAYAIKHRELTVMKPAWWLALNTEEVDVISLFNVLIASLIVLPTGESVLPKPEPPEPPPKVEAVTPKAPPNETYEVTWYTAGVESTGKSPSDPAYGITASGTQATEGRTAACPSSLAFGTRINIEGVGVRTCEDTGSAIRGKRLDVYVESVSEAIQRGRQSVKVEIINEGKR